MEQILWLYDQPYDPLYPVLCFDERPCFLIGEVLEPIPMESGKVKKQHYAYEKNGACNLLAAIEPLKGKRMARVFDKRRKIEYAQFMKQIAQAYPHARKIRIVQDNLNTHTISAFYEHFPAQEAFELAQRFEFFFTPTCASWLNMIEIEFSALARACLNARIPDKQLLEQKVMALIQYRNEKQIKINWQFSIKTARTKLIKKYQKVNNLNVECK